MDLSTVTEELRAQIRAEAAAGATEAVRPWLIVIGILALAAYLKAGK